MIAERDRLGMAWLIEPMVDRMEGFIRMDEFTWEDRHGSGTRRIVVDEDCSVHLETRLDADPTPVRSRWEVDGSSAQALLASFRRASDVHVTMIDRHVKSLKGELWLS